MPNELIEEKLEVLSDFGIHDRDGSVAKELRSAKTVWELDRIGTATIMRRIERYEKRGRVYA